MAVNKLLGSNPVLIVKEIVDIHLRKNFQNLRDYFDKQNQLLNFKFFEQRFAAATSNFKIAHGLAYIPEDIIVTKITGAGVVSFNHGLFDAQNIDISVDGPCLIRFYVGTYWNAPTSQRSPGDITKYASSAAASVSLVPTGSILAFGGSAAPAGFLLCDGTSHLKAQYPELYAVIGNANGTVSQDTFCVPDMRGRFMRGVDDGAGIDPDAASRTAVNGGNSGDDVGSVQDDALQNITGSFTCNAINVTSSSFVGVGAFVSALLGTFTFAGGGGSPSTYGKYSFDASRIARTSTETRPKNLGVNFIIKT